VSAIQQAAATRFHPIFRPRGWLRRLQQAMGCNVSGIRCQAHSLLELYRTQCESSAHQQRIVTKVTDVVLSRTTLCAHCVGCHDRKRYDSGERAVCAIRGVCVFRRIRNAETGSDRQANNWRIKRLVRRVSPELVTEKVLHRRPENALDS
jgi:hypothetical protein